MGEDLGNHGGIYDGGEDRQGAAAVGTLLDVDSGSVAGLMISTVLPPWVSTQAPIDVQLAIVSHNVSFPPGSETEPVGAAPRCLVAVFVGGGQVMARTFMCPRQ
jgi:hypothetical protein